MFFNSKFCILENFSCTPFLLYLTLFMNADCLNAAAVLESTLPCVFIAYGPTPPLPYFSYD